MAAKANVGDKKGCFIAIDLKSFFASVECMERGLDPMKALLVVADESRTEKTICLAVSPALKAYGIPGRPRLFEVVQKAKGLDYIVAKPRMALYMEYSSRVYNVYLKYIAPEDIHVYSIDEVFIDAAPYLSLYKKSAKELAMTMISDVLETTGITATAGIGANLYLAKIAMDINAKHTLPDENGVRMAELDEAAYRQTLWSHKPLTDFWRIGKGYEKKLASVGLHTMGDIARCSIGKDSDFYNEELLYRLFGVNAELLIDHAWGYEPCTMADIKSYRPSTNSINSGQVLQSPYTFAKTRIVVKEMAENLSLDLLSKGLVTNRITLTIGYDIENLKNPAIKSRYVGDVVADRYGRQVPKHSHGTENFKGYTDSAKEIREGADRLFFKIANEMLLVRRLTITADRVVPKEQAKSAMQYEQLDIFTDSRKQKNDEDKEQRAQKAVLEIKRKFGKNAILKGTNLQQGATATERNSQIGGHHQ